MKVLVVDDHPVTRDGVRHVLAELDPAAVTVEAPDAESALRLIEEHADLDLMLLDLALPDIDGFTVLKHLRERRAALPVVILSASEERPVVMMALRMGARGYIPKSLKRELLIQALRMVIAGGVYIPPQALGLEKNIVAPGAVAPPGERLADKTGLTERQIQILALIAQGKPNKVIAADLKIAEPTVKAHVTEILRALKVSNRAQALLVARQLGLGARKESEERK